MYTVTLKFETLDGVRDQMEYYRGYANAHNQLVEFWQTLRLEPIVPTDEAA